MLQLGIYGRAQLDEIVDVALVWTLRATSKLVLDNQSESRTTTRDMK